MIKGIQLFHNSLVGRECAINRRVVGLSPDNGYTIKEVAKAMSKKF